MLKKLSAIFLTICTLASFLLAFSSCVKDGEKNNGDDAVEGIDISGYTLVRSQKASENLISAVAAIKNRIKESVKVGLDVSDDWLDGSSESETELKEILIGSTNRDATELAKKKLDASDDENAFVIEVLDNKIVILGKNDEITVRALKYFATEFVAGASHEGYITIDENYSYIGSADTSTTILYSNLVEFSISKNYAVFTPEDTSNSHKHYPKMVYLQHQKNEKNNGTLLATLNSGERFYRIMRSRDNGNTWSEIAQVSDTLNKSRGLASGRMPFLYELPVDMGDYKKGTIILAGTSSDLNAGIINLTSITLYASTDLGETWKTLYNIDYGGGQFFRGEQVDLGVWEPYLIYDDETGRLYCFYSDDSDPEHDQKLVYKYTTDMKTWVGKEGVKGKNGADSTPFDIVCCDDPDYRPGMISVVEMNNGEYFAVYDIVVYAPGRVGGQIVVDGKTYNRSPDLFKKASAPDAWDASDVGTVVQLEDGRYMGYSPWCAYSPTLGENGMLVVFGRSWSDKGKNDQTDLFLSFDYGESFIPFENPFKYSLSDASGENTYCGYSPSLVFSPDGKTLYYMNNPTYGRKNQTNRIELVRIDIIY